jgi:hypothetical protein
MINPYWQVLVMGALVNPLSGRKLSLIHPTLAVDPYLPNRGDDEVASLLHIAVGLSSLWRD